MIVLPPLMGGALGETESEVRDYSHCSTLNHPRPTLLEGYTLELYKDKITYSRGGSKPCSKARAAPPDKYYLKKIS